jgi:hypothetical protein
MSETCSIQSRGGKCMKNFDGYNLKKRDHLEDLGVDKRIIFKRTLKK